MNYLKLNDIVVMKKPHACGFNEWKIVRYGADVKLQCLNCKRIIMLERPKFMKRFKKKILPKDDCDGK